MKFCITNFLSKCGQIRSSPRILSYLLKKSVMENFIYCAVTSEKRFSRISILYVLNDDLHAEIIQHWLSNFSFVINFSKVGVNDFLSLNKSVITFFRMFMWLFVSHIMANNYVSFSVLPNSSVQSSTQLAYKHVV